MPRLRSRAWGSAPIDEAFAFFDDPANLSRLMPPPVAIHVARVEPRPIRPGSEVEFHYGLGPFRRSWTIRVLERVPTERIVDETLAGPVRRFRHAHLFAPGPRGGTWVEDRVDYHVGPAGPLGRLLDGVVGVLLRLAFVWRHAMQRRLLRRR